MPWALSPLCVVTKGDSAGGMKTHLTKRDASAQVTPGVGKARKGGFETHLGIHLSGEGVWVPIQIRCYLFRVQVFSPYCPT